MVLKYAMMFRAGDINVTLCSSAIDIMAVLVEFGIAPCLRADGILPSLRKHHQARSETLSIVRPHLWFRPIPTCSPASMKERIRGKPKRGTPWKPRRPQASLSASPMTDSSSHPQTMSPATTSPPTQSGRRRSAATQPPSPSLLLHSMATILRGSPPTHCSPPDPRMQFVATMSFPGSSSTWRSAPLAFGESKRLCLHPVTHSDSEHFRERLGILYDLVFELRREVADLKFRLQATEDNVTTFLQVLSAMHSELSTGPSGTAPGEAIDPEMDSVLRQATTKQKETTRSGPVEHKEREECKETCRDDQLLNTEAEPWAEDLRATWLGSSPGV